MATSTCILFVFSLIYLTTATTNSQLTAEEFAQRQYQLSLDTFGYINEQLRVQQAMFEEQIKRLEDRLTELEARRPVGGRGGGKGSGRGGGGGRGGGEEPTQDRGGNNGDGGKGGATEAPHDPPVVTESRTTMKKDPTTMVPTTTMKATTQTPTTTMKTTTVTPTTLAAFPRFEPTCAIIYLSGYTTSGDYTIDPDGFGSNAPFTAYCDMDNGEGITIVGHDSEEENIPVNGFEDPGSFILQPTYGSHGNEISMRQLGALSDASYECQQFVKYACKSSGVMQRDKKTGLTYAWWVDRYGAKHVNWGGTTTDSGMCACGVTNSCFNGSPNCNCDHPKAKNQVDEGYLDDTYLLPVQTLNLGDTGSKKERGAVTLGKFICKG